MKILNYLGLVVILIVISGCASFTSPARQHMLEEGRTYWFDYDASRRGAVLIPKHEKKNIAICAEPSPDVAFEIVNKFKVDVGIEKLDVGVQADIQEKVIQLAKRTQTIMFLRESLYRLCELSLNFQLRDEDVRRLYEKVIEAAADLAKAELANAEQAKAESQEKLLQTMRKTPGLIEAYKESLKSK